MRPNPLPKRERTRDKLLVAAQELVMESGLATIGIHDVAKRADVAPGTFYNYFRTREDVADAIAQMLERAYHRDVDAVTREASDPVQIVASSMRQTLAWASPGGDLGRLMLMLGGALVRFVGSVRARAGRDLRAGVRAGAFHVVDMAVAQSMLAGIVHGALLDMFVSALPLSASPTIVEHSLALLGVTPARARRAANAPIPLKGPPSLPMTASDWLDPVGIAAGDDA